MPMTDTPWSRRRWLQSPLALTAAAAAAAAATTPAAAQGAAPAAAAAPAPAPAPAPDPNANPWAAENAEAGAAGQCLWYRRPADEWVQALPLGNGRLGAMVFGGMTLERVQLNENSFFAGGPYNPTNPRAAEGLPRVRELIFAGRYAEAEKLANETLISVPNRQMAYQPLAELLLVFPGLENVRHYERHLSLPEATARTRFRTGSVEHVREAFVSAADQVVVLRLAASRPRSLTVDVLFSALHQQTQALEDGHTLVLGGTSPEQQGIAGRLPFEARCRVIATGGRVQPRPGGLHVSGADEVLLLIAGATGYRRFDDVGGDPAAANRATLARLQGRSFADLRQAHLADYQPRYGRVQIELGRGPLATLPTDERIARYGEGQDPGLAAMYLQYGRYLLLSSSRPGTRHPANLQGIWNEKQAPSWQSKWTLNINAQMNYWPAELCNIGETMEPLMAMVEDLALTGAKLAQQMYGAPGWVVFNNTDAWRVASPPDGAVWALWPMGGVWLLQNLWETWLFRRDKAWLQRLYPLMKGAAEFQLATLVRDPRSGFMVTNPSNSPENRHPFGSSVCAGPAMDNQLLRDLFANVAQACEVLGVDAPFARRCLALRAQLPPDRIGAAGQLQEWQEDWDLQAPDLQHRHVSHLYALHPSDQITPEDTPALAAAARNVMVRRGEDTTGWGIGWRINLWARLKEGALAQQVLQRLLHPRRSYPNLFDAHPPFQIDGNFGGAAGIAEMLLQSHRGRIELLPALSPAWPAGRVSGLCARGGFEVALQWADGEVRRVEVLSRAGEKALLRWRGGERPIALPAGGRLVLQGQGGRLAEVRA